MRPHHFDRAKLLFQQGRYSLAEEECRLAISSGVNIASQHTLLAQILFRLNRNEEAISEASLALQFNPEYAWGYFILGHILLDSDKITEAEDALKTAIRLDINNPSYRYWLGLLYSNKEEYEMAKTLAEEGLAIDASNVACLQLRAFVLSRLKFKQEAIDDFTVALRIEPDTWTTHLNYATILKEQGQYAKALAHFQEALRQNPSIENGQIRLLKILKANHWLSRQIRWLESNIFDFSTIVFIVFLIAIFPVLFFIPFLFPFILLIGLYPIFSDLYLETFMRMDISYRRFLSREQILASNIFIYLLSGSIFSLLYSWTSESDVFFYLGLLHVSLFVPLKGTMSLTDPNNQRRSAIYGIGLAFLGATLIGMAALYYPFKPKFIVAYLSALGFYSYYRLEKLTK